MEIKIQIVDSWSKVPKATHSSCIRTVFSEGQTMNEDRDSSRSTEAKTDEEVIRNQPFDEAFDVTVSAGEDSL